ncbi:hypothetical protein [Clostridium neonatale]|uniref:hypothetical protein n=1 Tax=Clostridium neonatale TaxID=137838 RepID=UPI00374FD66B
MKKNNLEICPLNMKEFEGLSDLELLAKTENVITKIKRREAYVGKDKMKYNNKIMGDVREHIGLERTDISRDLEIYQMDRKDVLNAVCIKNGLKVHGDIIIDWIENIYQIKLEDKIQ